MPLYKDPDPFVRIRQSLLDHLQETPGNEENAEWRLAFLREREMNRWIGEALGADMPNELVSEVARRRMTQLAEMTRDRDCLLLQAKMKGEYAPAGWVDEYGNVYPLSSRAIEGVLSHHGAYKRGWQLLFRKVVS